MILQNMTKFLSASESDSPSYEVTYAVTNKACRKNYNTRTMKFKPMTSAILNGDALLTEP